MNPAGDPWDEVLVTHAQAVDWLPASIRGDFAESEPAPTGLAMLAATGLTAAQAAGRFTERVGGILVLPDTVQAAPWVEYGQAKPTAVLRVRRRDVGRVRHVPAWGRLGPDQPPPAWAPADFED